jgi:pyruvate/2-oxoglutarate dehydrogenase complex dihydrolipoamide acyltransferase (E2) component
LEPRVTRLDFAERWLRDGLQECGHAGGFEALDADATAASAILQHLKSEGVPVTWTHIFVRATAMVLARNPKLHQLVAGNSRMLPPTVDICLSIAGDSAVTPVVVIEDAANKDLLTIAAEIIRRTPQAAEETRKMLGALRRFGWVVPFSQWRRALSGFLLRRPWYRRKASGTFQVTCLPQVDLCAPLLFNTAAALGVGRVRDRVVAVNGQPAVRPTVTLYCCVDHSVWNGMAAAKFLSSLREVLETGEFAPPGIDARESTTATLQV